MIHQSPQSLSRPSTQLLEQHRRFSMSLQPSSPSSPAGHPPFEDDPNRGQSIQGLHSGAPYRRVTLAEIERNAILEAIDHCGGSPARAAKQLGISTATIYRKIKSYKRHTLG